MNMGENRNRKDVTSILESQENNVQQQFNEKRKGKLSTGKNHSVQKQVEMMAVSNDCHRVFKAMIKHLTVMINQMCARHRLNNAISL